MLFGRIKLSLYIHKWQAKGCNTISSFMRKMKDTASVKGEKEAE